jgi:hypothetical protein
MAYIAWDHPLMRYRGVPSWPPDWVWRNGLEDKRRKGEIGVFRRVAQSSIQPTTDGFFLSTMNNHPT